MCNVQITRDNVIRSENYCKLNIAIFHDEEDGPMPSSVVSSMDPSWHSRRTRGNYASLPPFVATVASIFSTLIRGPIGRRHRIYYNLQRIFRWGALLLLPLPRRVSPNDMRRYITEQETVWGKRGQGRRGKGRASMGRRRWQ